MSAQAQVFLDRARSLIERGEHESALALLVVALDNAPGDEVVVREADSLTQRIERARTQQESLREHSAPVGPTPPRRGGSRRPPRPATDAGLVIPATDPIETPVVIQPRARSRLVIGIAWSALFVVVIGALGLIMWPQQIETLLAYRQLEDPYAQATRLLRGGDGAGAIAAADRLVAQEDRVGAALLLIASVHAGNGDGEKEAPVLHRAALHGESSWEVSLQAARRLLELGRTEWAEEAYRAAFQHGAPAEHWLEIAQAFYDLGRPEAAISLFRTIERSHPAGADSARRALRGLGALGSDMR